MRGTVISGSNTNSGFHALTFHHSTHRRNKRVDNEQQAKTHAASDAGALVRRRVAARRTAWIVAAIAAAFFIASLLQGHFAHIPR
jgi:hypothetical protein